MPTLLRAGRNNKEVHCDVAILETIVSGGNAGRSNRP